MYRSKTSTKSKLLQVFKKLSQTYPDAQCTLRFTSKHQFLFANILSPQTTDKLVNQISVKMYNHFGSAKKIAESQLKEIQGIIRPLGFYKVKSKYIKKSAKLLIDKFNGKLPDDIDELQEFPGIGRKTALVILAEVFAKIEGIVIDTHNIRIVNRLGFLQTQNPLTIENWLKDRLKKTQWRDWSNLCVFHGRAICVARNPKCDNCSISDLCDFAAK